MTDEYERRKNLTFAQAEGAEPLPTQLQLKELSPELRSRLWHVIYNSLLESRAQPDYSKAVLTNPWRQILYDMHVFHNHRMADDFSYLFDDWRIILKNLFVHGDYIKVFDFIQWVLRHPARPNRFDERIAIALRGARAAYAVQNGYTIIPIASAEEGKTLERAFADVASSEFGGARTHLHSAASALTRGDYAESIRESIHAVESVARILEPSAQTLAPALAALAKASMIHSSLSGGFAKLYGFTNDEKGIRHPLLDEPVAAVDEADALYMLGSCAAFVSYLINKARTAGLIKSQKAPRCHRSDNTRP